MFKTEEFNNLPKAILERIPKLTGQTVKYRVNGGYIDKHNGGRLKFPFMKTVPPQDIITGDSNEIYQIAHITRNGGSPEMIVFENSAGGHIIISPDANGRYRAADIVMHEYLSLCNYNGSNPHRDSTKEAIFEEINDAKVAEGKVQSKLTSIDLIRRIATLSDDHVKLVASKFGVLEPQDSTQALRLKLIQAAEDDHDQLSAIINQVEADGEHLVNLQRAIDNNLIVLDRRTFTWKWKSTKLDIREADRQKSTSDNVHTLARWMRDTEDGSAVYKTLITTLG